MQYPQPQAQTPPSQFQKQQKHKMHNLPAIELALYLAFFMVTVISAGFAFREQVSVSELLDLDATSLKEGFLGYKMDNTYMDFNYFLSGFAPLLGVLSAHLVISRVTLRYCNLQVHHLACAAFTLALSCSLLSVRCTTLLLSLHFGSCFAGCLTGTPGAWAAALVAFLHFGGASFGGRGLRSNLQLDARGAHLFYPISGYLYCRFLSMGLCMGTRTEGSLVQLLHHIPATLHYAFYLPNFLGGPVVTMEEFLAQQASRTKPSPGWRRDAAWRTGRLLMWLCVTLGIVHCLHAGAYLETVGLRISRRGQPIKFAHLAFAMYARGQLFMLEYVQYYGWPALFASLDGIQLPHWPACICRVASYREMWRLFDRGLFNIVREHVYIPLGGSRRGLVRQLIATAASFGFICVYHGNYDSVQAWILLNLALVVVELLAVKAYRSWIEVALLRWTSPTCVRRLAGCLAAANLIPPSVGIFYFFYGTYAGKLFMREIFLKPLTGQSSIASFGIFYATFYCSVQLAIEYKLRVGESNKD